MAAIAPLIPIAMQLATFAPSIVKWLSGSDKAETVAADMVSIAQQVTGMGSAEGALASIAGDPGKALEFREKVMANALEYDRIYLADVQNARTMQIAALQQDDPFSKRFVYYFAAGWSLFAMIYFLVATLAKLDPGGQRIADTILGVLIASVIGVMFQFFYGSTQKSRTKDDTINRLTNR